MIGYSIRVCFSGCVGPWRFDWIGGGDRCSFVFRDPEYQDTPRPLFSVLLLLNQNQILGFGPTSPFFFFFFLLYSFFLFFFFIFFFFFFVFFYFFFFLFFSFSFSFLFSFFSFLFFFFFFFFSFYFFLFLFLIVKLYK